MRFGSICTIYKNVKNTHGWVTPLVKLQTLACSITKSITLPWIFSRILNWQMIWNDAKHVNCFFVYQLKIYWAEIYPGPPKTSKMKNISMLVVRKRPLAIVGKLSIWGIFRGSSYVSAKWWSGNSIFSNLKTNDRKTERSSKNTIINSYAESFA